MRPCDILGIIIFFALHTCVVGLKCYQCSTTRTRGCFQYNLNSDYLRECKNVSKRPPPVCRSLSQVHYFTPGQEVTVVRECAYIYTEPLQCQQSKFGQVHYSLACECNADGCNSAFSGRVRDTMLIIILLLWATVIK